MKLALDLLARGIVWGTGTFAVALFGLGFYNIATDPDLALVRAIVGIIALWAIWITGILWSFRRMGG
jgi:hypothetical protein